MLFRPPLDLGLNRVKGRHVNNRFMAICHRIFGKLTCIHNLPLGNMILAEGLLQEQVSCVGDIPENPLHAGWVPLHTKPGDYAVTVQLVRNCLYSFPG